MSETCKDCKYFDLLNDRGPLEYHCSKFNIRVLPEGRCNGPEKTNSKDSGTGKPSFSDSSVTIRDIHVNPSILDSGERTEFNTGAVRDMHEGKGRMDLLPWEALIEVSKHCEEGAKKYGERNCEKGIPIHSLIDSAFRHLAKYTIGMDDEPHLRAAAWNILFALYMEQVHPEMQDIPARMQNLDKS